MILVEVIQRIVIKMHHFYTTHIFISGHLYFSLFNIVNRNTYLHRNNFFSTHGNL